MLAVNQSKKSHRDIDRRQNQGLTKAAVLQEQQPNQLGRFGSKTPVENDSLPFQG
jgi:hypothetical protein